MRRASHCRAIHLDIAAFADGESRHDRADPPNAEESAWLAANAERRKGLMAYQQVQGTVPLTLVYGLTESPVGPAARILEKFQARTVPGLEGSPPFDFENLLTNVMRYRLGGINAANWLNVSIADGTSRNVPFVRKVTVPTGFMMPRDDNALPPPDRCLARRYGNIVHRNDAPRGGHFLALEQGPLFVAELRTFFRPFRAAAPGA